MATIIRTDCAIPRHVAHPRGSLPTLGVVSIGGLVLLCLLGLATTAAAVHSVPSATATTWALAEESSYVNFQVTNPSGSLGTVDKVAFNLKGTAQNGTMDGTFTPVAGTDIPTGWTIESSNTTGIIFATTVDQYEAATARNFSFRLVLAHRASDQIVNVNVTTHSSTVNPDDQTNTTVPIQLRTVGIKTVTVQGFDTNNTLPLTSDTSPANKTLPTNQTLHMWATIVNHGESVFNGFSLRFSTNVSGEVSASISTGPIQPATVVPSVVLEGFLPIGGTTFASSTGPRTFTAASVSTGTGANVVPYTAKAIVGYQPDFILSTLISDTNPYISAFARIGGGATNETVNISWKNAGFLAAQNVIAYLTINNATGANWTSNFTLTSSTVVAAHLDTDYTAYVPATGVALGNVAGGAPNATLRFRIQPLVPSTGQATTNGTYNITVRFAYSVTNLDVRGNQDLNRSAFFTADSSAPEVSILQNPILNAKFQRNNANLATIKVKITDQTVNTTGAKLLVKTIRWPVPSSASYFPLCDAAARVCTDTISQEAGSTYTIAKEFWKYELVDSFAVNATVTDLAGNVAVLELGTYKLNDEEAADVTNGPFDTTGDGTVQQGVPVSFTATVADNYRVANRTSNSVTSPGDAGFVGNLASKTGVFLRVRHNETNEEIFGGDGRAMLFQGVPMPFSNNGTYKADSVTIDRTGGFTYRIFMRDANGNERESVPGYLRIVSALDFYFLTGNNTKVKGVNYTTTDQVDSQVSPARFGVSTAAGTLQGTYQLVLENTGQGQDAYIFACAPLSGTTVNLTAGCNASNITAASEHNVTVHVTNLTDPNGAVLATPLLVDPAAGMVLNPFASGSATGKALLRVNVTPPANARIGDIVKINLTVKSKFVSTVSQTVVLGFVVSEGRGVDMRFATGNELENTSRIKPSRTIEVPVNLSNPGNVALNYTVAALTGLPTGWDFDYASSDSRFLYNPNLKTATILLDVAGSGANRTSDAPAQRGFRVRITADPNAPPTTTDFTFPLKVTASGVTDLTRNIKVGVDAASLQSQAAAFIQVVQASRSNATINDTRCYTGTGSNGCAWGSSSDVFNITFESRLNSTRNANNASDQIGFIRAAILVQAPNGTLTNDTLDLVDAYTGSDLPGRDGIYRFNYTVRDHAAKLRFSLYADDGIGGDQIFSNPRFDGSDEFMDFFTIKEAGSPGATPPVLFFREVKQDGTALVLGTDGALRATFGKPIAVTAKFRDDFDLGRATLKVDHLVSGQAVPTLAETVMAQSANVTNTTVAGARILEAQFDASPFITGDPATAVGLYQFTIRGYDAVENQATPNATLVFQVNLADLSGPVFSAVNLTGGGVTGGNITIERNATVSVDLKVSDAGETTSGANVNPATVIANLRRSGSTSVLATISPLTRDTADVSHYTGTFGSGNFTTEGTYLIEVVASDLNGNAAVPLNQTVIVAPNLKPRIDVTSPSPVDGIRYVGNNGLVSVTINDENLDFATIVVEKRVPSGNTTGNFTAITPTILTGKPTLVNITVTDNLVFYRVTAKDLSNETNVTEFEVRIDAGAPIASISLDPLDPGHSFVTTGTTYIASTMKLLVAGTDTGSGLAGGAVRVVVTKDAGTPANRSFDAGQKFTLGDVLGAAPTEARYTVAATVTDKAGNVATATPFVATVDAAAPVAGTITPADPLTVTITDSASGVRSAEVEWSSSQDMAGAQTFALNKTGDSWTGQFPAAASGDAFFRVKATDNVGNVATAQCGASPCRVVFGNRPPQITAGSFRVEPTQTGGVVRGTVNVTWNVTDPERSQVVSSLKLRSSGGNVTSLPGADAITLQPYRWDTTAVPDGTYTLLLESSDGSLKDNDTLSVTVRNLAVRAVEPLPAETTTSDTLLFAYNVTSPTKNVSSVQAIVRGPGGQDVVTLFDDGTHGDKVARDGIFSATYTPRLSGQNNVDLKVQYSDNTSTTVSNVGTFRVAGGGIGALPGTLIPVVVLGLVVVAMGVFGLRRWK